MKLLDDAQNSVNNDVSLANRNSSSPWPLLVALGAGTITALLSVSLEHSAPPFIGNAEFIVTAIVFPGILGSVALAGNAHAFSLWIAAGINFIFYFVLVWTICGVSRRILRRFR